MEKKFKIAIFIVVWFLLGLLLMPLLVQGIRTPTSLWIPRPEFLAIVVVLVFGVVFVGKTMDWFDRLIAGTSIVFHSLPTLALMFEPTLYWMVFPAGAFLLLGLPWNPIFLILSPIYYFNIRLTLPLMSLGTFLLLGGTGIFIASLIQLLRGRGLLVSTSLYSLVRHPQYLGITLATLGLTFMGERLNLVSVLSWVTLVFAYVFLAYREERNLQKRFGSEFRPYKRRVPFMLPFLPPGKLEPLLPSQGLKRHVLLWVLINGIVVIFWINVLF
jgi:protein-S-isoprenylcysteine O-methyltransferase Ste14